LLFLAILSLVVALDTAPAQATTWYNVTVRTVGLYPNVGAKVYAGSRLMGTIYGEGVLTFNTTYGPTVSVESHVPNGYPYYGYPYYTYPGPLWGPLGYNGVAFFCRFNSQKATANTTVTLTFKYDPLFFLYVKSERGRPEGTGWYLAGSWARVAVATPIEEGADTRYRFDRWTGAQLQESANTPVNLVYMDSPKIVEALWVPQYKLTVNSPYGQVSGGGWYDRDQVASFSVASPVMEGEGIRHVFNSWTGDYSGSSVTGMVTMDAPKTVTATWKTQYLLTVDPKGGQVDKSTEWLDRGTTVSVTAQSPCNVAEKRSRLVFAGWLGATTSSSNTVTLVMDGPKTLTATWKRQYYLTVETKHGAASGEGWYDEGSIAEFSVPSEIPMESPLDSLGGKYVFNGWSGDSTATTNKANILMDSPHVVTASWTGDYSTVVALFVALTVIATTVGVLAGFTIRKQRSRVGAMLRKTQTEAEQKLPAPKARRKVAA
jgi:uncharacterized repeat protein (TIGR02543 family)